MRKARITEKGARYHVTARTNRQEFIFNSPDLKELFLNIMKRAKQKFKFQLENFCIMGNHIHLLIRPLHGEKLSKIMQWILGTFAINYNKMFNFKGHVWYDRFHSSIIRSFNQFLKTFQYICDNPVKARIVKFAKEYKFGGLWFLRKGSYELAEPPSLMVVSQVPGTGNQLLLS